jgi:hypothetical protein
MAGGRTSVFKAAGSLPETYPVRGVKMRVDEDTGIREKAHTDARVSPAGLTHAFNNKATQKAAEQQGRGSGTSVPPVAVQEVGWVQMRKDAGKDPEFNQRKTEAEDPLHGEIRGQGALFGDHVPGAGKTPLDRPAESDAPDMTPNQQEADLRKWAAIGKAHHRKQARQSMGGLFNDRRG